MNLDTNILDSFMIAWEMDKEIALEYLIECLLKEIDLDHATKWIEYITNM